VVGSGAANAQTVHVHETGYVGPFTESDDCAGKVTVAVKPPSTGNGMDSDYTVTANASVVCTATFSDAFNQHATVHINATVNGIVIQRRKHR
jgi:hypothetical protein